MEIAEDGTVREDELSDFIAIKNNLNKISSTIDSLKLWVSQAVINGTMEDPDK